MTLTAGVAAGLIPTAGADMTNTVLSRASSASGQFTALAPGQLLASITCVFAERVKHECLAQLGLPDQWRDPITLVVRERDSSNASEPGLRVDAIQNEVHLRYQITCLIPPPPDEGLMTAALVQVLCEEISNRDQRTLATTGYERAPIPPWLTWGLTELVRGRGTSLLELVRRSVEAGRPPTASELLETTALPSDPSEQELFRANAWALTEGLLALPDGPQKMQRFLRGLGATKSAQDAFLAAFGADFPKEVNREKWWSLQQAFCTTATVPENLSIQETGRQLEILLPTDVMEYEGKSTDVVRRQVLVQDLWRYYDKPWMADVLKAKLNNLEMLRSQAHPFYRTVIDEYIRALILLMEEKLNQCRRTMAAAERSRVSAEELGQQITAYLDREERVYSPDDFANWAVGYFRTLNQIQALDSNRHDPISDYLDEFDK